MDTNTPNNIVLWCMHRSGSTHFGQRLASSMSMVYGKLPHVANLGEATGIAGFVSAHMNTAGIWEEMETHLYTGTEFFTDHVKWTLDENNSLQSMPGYGSINDEIASRVKILKDNSWKNHVVFRNQRWPKMKSISTVYDSAILEGNFHHVVLWRRDLFAWLCSFMIFRMTKTPHGNDLEYDGVEYTFRNKDKKTEFLSRQKNYLMEFKESLMLLPTHSTVMIETNKMNNVSLIEWPDGNTLDMVDPTKIKKGMTVWKNTATGERVLPPDMITDADRDMFQEWANQVEQELGWPMLAENLGFKTA